MPNAQVPYVTFWQNRIAQDDLRKFLVEAGVRIFTAANRCRFKRWLNSVWEPSWFAGRSSSRAPTPDFFAGENLLAGVWSPPVVCNAGLNPNGISVRRYVLKHVSSSDSLSVWAEGCSSA